MPDAPISNIASRVLFLPPTRRDAEVIGSSLERAELPCTICRDILSLSVELDRGAGALLITDSAFSDSQIDTFAAALERQPSWSDVPAVVLCQAGAQSNQVTHCLQSMRNVTVLEKPTSLRTLISTIKAALRARGRQYQLRDQFDALQASEAALQNASQALSDSNRRKDEFLAMLAHELRNPLAPIMNATEIVSRLTPDLQMQQTARLLKRQVTHLTRLVDDLLDLSRITAGRIELRRAPLDIAAVIAQAREIVEPSMREKRHRFLVAANYETLYVNGDHSRLVQSIANVLSNAAKYTDVAGEILLEVNKVSEQVVIAITDTGIGIAPELLPRIFDLFVQADQSLDRSQGGLGIGLCVVKRLIEMHEGTVTAESKGLGCGSTFKIYLPLIQVERASATDSSEQSLEPRRVLIVDDNADAANSLAMLLELEGHHTETVYSAQEAIDRAIASRPDILVLDIGLPDMNGYEVASRLRSALSNTQIIALTGYGQAEDVRRAEDAGFDAHVIKPVDFANLKQLIGGFAREARAHHTTRSALEQKCEIP